MLHEFLSYKKFIKNKYYYWYLNLSKKIINETRNYDSNLHENHHILPDALGGSIMLPYTFKEHYIAHLLLTKFTTGVDKHKMTFAIHTFFHFDRNRRLGIHQSSITYEIHKRNFIESCKATRGGNTHSTADKKNYKFKCIATEEVFEGTRIDFLKYTNDLTNYDLNALIRAYKKGVHWKAKGWAIYNDKLKAYSHDVEKIKQPPAKKYKCQWCGAVAIKANLNRWHSDNCKLKPS
jgi:hypothetical protein